MAVHEDVLEEAQGLPLGDVVVGAEHAAVRVEELLVLAVQEVGDGLLVLQEELPVGKVGR